MPYAGGVISYDVRIQVPRVRSGELERWLEKPPTDCGGKLIASQKSGEGGSIHYSLRQVCEPYEEELDVFSATWAVADGADVDAVFSCLRSHLDRFGARMLPPRNPRR
jgi:hypothetical protein